MDNITKIRFFNYIKYLMTSNCQKIILAAILKTDFNRFTYWCHRRLNSVKTAKSEANIYISVQIKRVKWPVTTLGGPLLLLDLITV